MLEETGDVRQALQMNQELGLGLEAEPLHQHSGEKDQKQPPTATWLRDHTELVTVQSYKPKQTAQIQQQWKGCLRARVNTGK